MSLSRQNIVNILNANIKVLNSLLIKTLKRTRIEKLHRGRRFGVNPVNRNRLSQGYYYNLVEEMRLSDTETFCNFHRMNPQGFDELLTLVGPLIERIDVGERSITASQRLSLTLRYLASGDSMISIGSYGYRVGKATTSIIIRETCDALWNVLKPIVFPTPSTDMWKQISSQFEEQWNFPHCLGAMDGKHVIIQAFGNVGSLYRNYKHSHSVVLFAICDANYKFIFVDIGAPGHVGDSNIFRRSNFGRSIICGGDVLHLPPPENLEDGKSYPYVFIGDEAFPLLPNLLRPYPGRNTSLLPPDKSAFNYRLSRARRVVENAFGILASRWRIYRKPIIASKITVLAIIKATVVLHNWLRDKRIAEYMNANYYPADEMDQRGTSRNNESGMQPVNRVGSNNSSRSANETRDQFKSYFNEVDVLPWQYTSKH